MYHAHIGLMYHAHIDLMYHAHIGLNTGSQVIIRICSTTKEAHRH